MKHDTIAITLLTVIAIHLGFSGQKVFAYFSASGTSVGNTFIASIPTPSPSPIITSPPSATPTPLLSSVPDILHVVINEVQPIGTSSAEWVELYNPTNQAVDVSGWKIRDVSITPDVFGTISPISSHGYAIIIANTSTVAGIPTGVITIQLQSAIGDGLSGTSEYLELQNPSGQIIDTMSYGSNNTAFPNPPSAPTTNHTLSRIPNGADTDTSTDWINTAPATIGVSN